MYHHHHYYCITGGQTPDITSERRTYAHIMTENEQQKQKVSALSFLLCTKMLSFLLCTKMLCHSCCAPKCYVIPVVHHNVLFLLCTKMLCHSCCAPKCYVIPVVHHNVLFLLCTTMFCFCCAPQCCVSVALQLHVVTIQCCVVVAVISCYNLFNLLAVPSSLCAPTTSPAPQRALLEQMKTKAQDGSLRPLSSQQQQQQQQQAAAAAAAARKKRRWDQVSEANTPQSKRATWDEAMTPAVGSQWAETPGRSKGSDTPGATPAGSQRMWDATPGHATPGHETPGRDVGHATPSSRKNRWDETPKTERGVCEFLARRYSSFVHYQ